MMKLERFLNKVICGDCLEVIRKLPSESIDLVLTDPPYGVRKREQWDNNQLFLSQINDWLSECFRVSRYGVLWFCADKMLPDILSLPLSKSNFHRILTWEKPPGSQYAGSMQNKIWYSTELILVFRKGFLNKKGKKEPYSYSVFKARTVPSKKYGHPTTKPIELIEWLIKHYSDTGDIILDPFLGSGTTAVAALNTGRFFIGIEKEPKYVEIANKRIQEAMRQKQFTEGG